MTLTDPGDMEAKVLEEIRKIPGRLTREDGYKISRDLGIHISKVWTIRRRLVDREQSLLWREKQEKLRRTSSLEFAWRNQVGDASWMKDAACKEAPDPELFHPIFNTGRPSRITGPGLAMIKTATMYCKPCPVRSRCLQFAVENEIYNGIWGGVLREKPNFPLILELSPRKPSV